jgi:hypothetical protein
MRLPRGAFVHLNSGSCVLHVVDRGSDDSAYVAWINDEGKADEMSAPAVCFHLSSEMTPVYIGK